MDMMESILIGNILSLIEQKNNLTYFIQELDSVLNAFDPNCQLLWQSLYLIGLGSGMILII